MERRIAVTILAFLVIGTGVFGSDRPECGEEERVGWVSYDEALKRARKEGRPVMIFFHADHCRKCELLADKGFSRPEIACYINQRLVAVRLKGKDHPELKKKYRVSSYPTVWFLTPEAGEIDYFLGYVTPERLTLILHYIGDRVYQDKSFDEYVKERAEQPGS